MPTDVNNLKDGQRVRVELTVADISANDSSHVRFRSALGAAIFLPRADIITDWPPEPNADEAGWETVLPAKYEANSTRFEYRVQRRPIAPKWVPAVGEDVWSSYVDGVVIVKVVSGRQAAVKDESGNLWVVDFAALTQPKDQPHDQD